MRKFLMKRIDVARLAVALASFAVMFGCGSGVMDTSLGPRPAAEVKTEDTAADVLKAFGDGYKAAAAKHDATPVCGDSLAVNCEPDGVHAEHRAVLKKTAAGLRASWASLIAAKKLGAAASTKDAIKVLVPLADPFLNLAVELNVLSPMDAERVRGMLLVLFPPNARRLHSPGDDVPLLACVPTHWAVL